MPNCSGGAVLRVTYSDVEVMGVHTDLLYHTDKSHEAADFMVSLTGFTEHVHIDSGPQAPLYPLSTAIRTAYAMIQSRHVWDRTICTFSMSYLALRLLLPHTATCMPYQQEVCHACLSMCQEHAVERYCCILHRPDCHA